ncbi:MAG TPA: hypothetical protein VF508_13520 [Pyrinomonadaceae bacterium]|jgi:integrase
MSLVIITVYIQKGGEATIAELTGHAEPKTTRRYTRGTERAKRAAVEAVGGRAFGPAAGAR